jgi:hypothetical protein
VTDDLVIYEAIADAVAAGREPDLSSFDPLQVRTSLERVLQFPVPRSNFLAWLNGRVKVISGGSVSIEERPTDEGAATAGLPDEPTTPELPIRVIVAGEPFAEPASVRADDAVLHFPLRG